MIYDWGPGVLAANANGLKLVLSEYIISPIFLFQACLIFFQFLDWSPGTQDPSGYAHEYNTNLNCNTFWCPSLLNFPPLGFFVSPYFTNELTQLASRLTLTGRP